MNSALDTQVGGNHYKDMPIQPMEYSMANGLDACQHTIIKYVTRFRQKGGIQDLEKARHTLDMLIEFERRHEGAEKAQAAFEHGRTVTRGKCLAPESAELCSECKAAGISCPFIPTRPANDNAPAFRGPLHADGTTWCCGTPNPSYCQGCPRV
jgi:hypothetical protein